jgi:hypothetical protein
MDNLKICDRCGSDACYTQEVNQEITNYQCYGCGFITNSLMKREHDFFKQQIELLPNLYKELMGEDEDGKIWMPSTVNVPTKGMVFAKGNNASNWKWAAVKVPRVNTVKGLTQEHIQKWGWNVNEKGWVNWPDYQWRILKNIPEIKWVNKVHEKLDGFKTYAPLPEIGELALRHPKTIERQEKQNNIFTL